MNNNHNTLHRLINGDARDLSFVDDESVHLVFPLHADICVSCRHIGFDNLNPIIWHKIANASYEVTNGSKFLGKPYEPNAIIKNDMEFILMQRKPGGYRKPSEEQRDASRISKDDFNRWFQQIWTIPGASYITIVKNPGKPIKSRDIFGFAFVVPNEIYYLIFRFYFVFFW